MPSFSKVWEDALSFKDKTEDEIIELDQKIRQMQTTIPDVLRAGPFSESIADDPFLIVIRLYVEFIPLKSLCVLHRKYMARGNGLSTTSCIDAGKRIVGQVIGMHREFSPGGLLHGERWMLGNFTINDFLLGVMVLCLAMHIRGKRGAHAPGINDATENEVIALLQQSQTILIEKSSASKDAQRVSHAVRLTLDTSKRGSGAAASSSFPKTPFTLSSNKPTVTDVGSADSTSFPYQSQSEYYYQGEETAFGQLDPFNFMGNDFLDFDWAITDPHIFDQDA